MTQSYTVYSPGFQKADVGAATPEGLRLGQAERIQERKTIEAQASARYGARGVPADWYVDPADPDAMERYRQDTESSLEDQATAFLAAHEALTGNALAGGLKEQPKEQPRPDVERAAPVRQVEQAVWIGLPGVGQEFDDEGELGWQADALCAQTDPEAFFPEKGGSTRDAKKVCGACNVRSQCLEYALASDERFGIWGGLSERERRRLRRRAV